MLRDKFYILCQKSTYNNKIIEILWRDIKQSYSNRNRYYHTLSHLENIYNELKPFSLTPEIEFSIFYHDIVYDIQKKDNEEKSALFAKKHLIKIDIPDKIITNIQRLIIETKSHKSTSSENTLFLDADLSILGSNQEIYKAYIQNIRKEYLIYSDKEYKKGRKEVLKKFLKKDRLYLSEHFYNLYEKNARENIKNELKLI